MLYAAAFYFHQPLAIAPVNSGLTPPVSLVAPIVAVANASSDLPVNINIPSINLDTAIENVGLTLSGEVGVPSNPANTAWYNLSPLPGDVGNSIIDGHYGWKNNIPVAFDHLNSIKIGDRVYITHDTGSTTVFVVTNLVVYGENNNDPTIFVSTDGKAHLNLITCGGVWNKVTKSYSTRLVVFTDLVVD